MAKHETKDQMLQGLKTNGAFINTKEGVVEVVLPKDWNESGRFGNKSLGRIDGLRKYHSTSIYVSDK